MALLFSVTCFNTFSKLYINFIIFCEYSSDNSFICTPFNSGIFPAFSITLFVLTYVYCIYGPVSPWKFNI